jgi:hypothetical protein
MKPSSSRKNMCVAGTVTSPELTPLQPDLLPVFGLGDEVAYGSVALARDYDRVVTILFPDLFERFVKVHLFSLAPDSP